MNKRTLVSIYEVDEWGTTGPWAGQGSLLASQLVLVHPPLSYQIAIGASPKRFRVGIFDALQDPNFSPAMERGLPEVIDVWNEPHIRWNDDSSQLAIVGLELRRRARSSTYSLPETESDESLPLKERYKKIAEHLLELSRERSTPEPLTSFWCHIFPRGC